MFDNRNLGEIWKLSFGDWKKVEGRPCCLDELGTKPVFTRVYEIFGYSECTVQLMFCKDECLKSGLEPLPRLECLASRKFMLILCTFSLDN